MVNLTFITNNLRTEVFVIGLLLSTKTYSIVNCCQTEFTAIILVMLVFLSFLRHFYFSPTLYLIVFLSSDRLTFFINLGYTG